MKQAALFILMSALAFGTYAQTEGIITTQTCNVALSQCTLADNNGDTVVIQGQWVYSGPVTISVVTPTGTQPTRSCSVSTTLVSKTLYKIVDDLAVNCDDGSTLSGTYTSTRSGSGRGGWAWHHHVFFESIVLY